MMLLAAFALARVAVAAQALEASFDSTGLRQEIKSERRLGDRLEADRSALTTPSRIERIAGSTMSMAAPSDVRYLTLEREGGTTAGRPRGSPADARGGGGAGSGLASMVAAAMSMAAGEAQVLLVGDVGLASSR